jgi:hypothetical protein
MASEKSGDEGGLMQEIRLIRKGIQDFLVSMYISRGHNPWICHSERM